MLREAATQLQTLVQIMNGEQPNLLPGDRLKIVDGTSLAASDRRLDAIRSFAAKAIPGKAIVVLDPRSKLVTDVFPYTDAQERCLFNEVLETLQPLDVWNGDRNFCTAKFLFTIAHKNAFFVIRQHGALGWRALSELQPLGETETGKIFEQTVEIAYQGKLLQVRRVLLQLFQPTQDRDWEIAILTNLPVMAKFKL